MAAIVDTSSAPYGLKAIRSMRGKKIPSERSKKKINDTFEYFYEKVDPVIGACITFLLCQQPDDIINTMIDFINSYKNNTSNDDYLPAGNIKSKPKRELKIYLATTIGPVVAKLVNRIAAVQPEDVYGFMTKELSSMKMEDTLGPDAPTTNNIIATAPKNNNNLTLQTSRNIQLAVVGLGGAGKSSILNMLTGTFESKIKPTIGFKPIPMLLGEDNIRFYDLGGGERIRDIWEQYYHDVHAVIYVVDSAANEADMKKSADKFKEVINHEYLKGKPVLILANKQDQDAALNANQIEDLMSLKTLLNFEYTVAECSSFVPEIVSDDFKCDSRIEAALERILNDVLQRFDIINAKVMSDTQSKATAESRKRIERERKVLKNKIASAFVAQLHPEIIQSLSVEADPANVFTEEEGVAFLAAEIGEEVSRIADIAVVIAQMVGFQRLALQIVGALKAPISKKKVPMSWDEIHALVLELRVELKLQS